MPDRYVRLTGSTPASPYDSWSNAASDLLTATAIAAAGETIYVDAATYTAASAKTYTLAAGVRIICSADTTNAPPQTLSTAGVIQTTGAASNILVNGAGFLVYGLTFQLAGTSATLITLCSTDGSKGTFESCSFDVATSSISSGIQLGPTSSLNTEVVLRNCSAKFSNAGQGFTGGGRINIIGGTYPLASGTIPTTLFKPHIRPEVTTIQGTDFSAMTSGTVFGEGIDAPWDIILTQCYFGAATLNSTIGRGGNEYWVYDSSSSDTHYKFQHLSYSGSTTISTTIYANDGAEYNVAGNKHSWVISGNANTSRANPYTSPWISKYNEGTSAVTPSIEILRDGSTTAYTDIQVWAEFLVKTVGGSPIASLIGSDFGGHLSTGTDQATGTTTWTGGSTPWLGKLAPSSSITPAEIGHVQARVCVSGNITVYVDPQIRDL